MIRKVYICNDSLTGIFSAIYDAWKEGKSGQEVGIALRGHLENRLFCEYTEVSESEKKSVAVERMIKKNLGYDTYWDIYHALLADDCVKADAVLGAMLAARNIPDSRKIMTYLSHPQVEKVFELSRSVANEAHLFTGFVRFCELENGILFSEISPKAQVLTCIADHFTNRFPQENWMIADKTHHMVLVHEAGRHWILAQNQKLDEEQVRRTSEKEDTYETLWKNFCTTISIENRENPSLQRSHIPRHFQQDMVEFDK
ncbi:probable DNA metabolism protein [Hespellia stercorisuis DSM 15480]|uniref:Probable DNA metabolism protein n=1 Tax=Hespellia stercorisuis DSM 15480 TaxID=1121950 RepID=A0A1M6PGN1_9FIRM|nr:TIGR03915 family putative DNA repair protein [Hespellia stercorisuis]SHK07050.1 probable DNA metabolism protein [Hespellia stercorisuis DSM 15480]